MDELAVPGTHNQSLAFTNPLYSDGPMPVESSEAPLYGGPGGPAFGNHVYDSAAPPVFSGRLYDTASEEPNGGYMDVHLVESPQFMLRNNTGSSTTDHNAAYRDDAGYLDPASLRADEPGYMDVNADANI
jgi:hypothetical protein